MSWTEIMVVERVERLSLRDLRAWVREGWVLPAQGEAGPVFDEIDLARVRLLRDLRKDMALPSDALPVVLNLIDRLNDTRRELRCLADAVECQPDEVRQAVREAFRARRRDDGG